MATVRYIVRDVDESVPFYEALGFKLVDRPGPPIAMVARGDLTLWLSGPQSSAARTLSSGLKPEPGGWSRLVIEVESIEAAMTTLKPAGGKFRGDPVSGPGGTQVILEDPSGNAIELFQPRRS